jgi:drug/metabolite transporter (DMT)-like permease
LLRGAIYGLTAAAIWGGMYVVSDIVLKVISPFSLLTIRLIIGALVLGVILAQTVGLRLPRRDVLRLMGVGVIGFGVSVGLQFVGTAKATAINGSVVTSASPAFILFFAWLILRERLTAIRVAAVTLASIGVLIILDLSKFDLSSQTFLGNIALAGAAVTWALYSVLVRKVSANYGTGTITFFALLGGLCLTIPAGALELQTERIGEITPGVILGIAYLGVVSTAVAMFLWNRAFALVEASVASLFFFAQPLVGVVLSNLLLQQPITRELLIGGALIGAGVLLSMVKLPTARVVNKTPGAKAPG